MPNLTAKPTLTPDEVDDLIYFSRTGDLPSLQTSLTELSTTHTCTPSEIVINVIDIDEDGLGSGSCLLHYPAANGNLEVVTHLLSLLAPSSTSTSEPVPATSTSTSAPATTSLTSTESSAHTAYINHQNISGNTALHWAAMNGHLSIVQALFKAGADPEIVNAAGRDVVVEAEYADQEGRRTGAAECAVWILKECGALEKGVGEINGEGSGGVENGDGEGDEDGEEKGYEGEGSGSASVSAKEVNGDSA